MVVEVQDLVLLELRRNSFPTFPCLVFVKNNSTYYFDHNRPQSIGKVISHYGNFLIVVRAYTYLKLLGANGLKNVSEMAVLNANYVMRKLQDHYDLPYDHTCMHEFVITSKRQNEQGVHTKDIAKRIIDKGYHPPTTYFPLIIEEALMIEPTETESKETLDQFIIDMIDIAQEVKDNPQIVLDAPHTTPVSKLMK